MKNVIIRHYVKCGPKELQVKQTMYMHLLFTPNNITNPYILPLRLELIRAGIFFFITVLQVPPKLPSIH